MEDIKSAYGRFLDPRRSTDFLKVYKVGGSGGAVVLLDLL